jgi:hypothetical protein
MRARLSDWITLAVALVGSALASLTLALLLNFSGDCAPQMTNCGEARRYASFVVLALGAACVAYLVVRFVCDPRRFR